GLAKKYRADNPYGDSEGSKDGDDQAGSEVKAELEPEEKHGLIWSMVSALLLTGLILFSVLIPNSPWRNEDGGFLPESPLLSSIVVFGFAYIMVMCIVYGLVVGSLRSMNYLVGMMSQAIIDMMPFLIRAFILGQFIALFNWTGIGSWIAVAGA